MYKCSLRNWGLLKTISAEWNKNKNKTSRLPLENALGPLPLMCVSVRIK